MRELRYVKNPNRTRLVWVAVYVLIGLTVLVGLLIAGSKIRTHTLPQGDIQLSVPYSKYFVGELVTYSLKNNYNSPIYIANKCPNEPLAVYRYENNTWARLHATAQKSSCPSEERQIELPARGVVNGTFSNWKELFSKPGYYRVVAYVEYYDALPYQDIEVVSAAKSASTPTTSQPKPTPTPRTPDSPSDTASLPISPTYTEKKSATVTSKGGKITVQYDSTTVYVTSIAPASGCSYEGGNSGTEVELTFKCSSGELQVKLWVQDGQLVGKAEKGD